MKFYRYFSILFLSLFSVTASWSNTKEPIVATVGGRPIYKSEFEYAYTKNSVTNKSEQLTPKQFLDYYIDYKLKVQEALNEGLDKKDNFRNEYSEYVNDLKRPYLEDSVSNIVWIKDIYNKLKENIEITDIFIPYSNAEYIYPKDTLETYKLAQSIKQKINKDGSNFEQVAEEYSTTNSTGKSLAVEGHKRWITSLLTDLKYENIIYGMNINEISDPIRSQGGYSIVKVLNKRPDNGSIKLSAIELKYPDNATKNQIDSVNALANTLYNRLIKGASFDSIYLQYSLAPDIETFGDLGFWSVRRPLNKVASEAVKYLIIGDYSSPFVLGNKVNILKITDQWQIPSFDKFKQDIIERLKYVDYINDFYVNENKAIKDKIKYTINEDSYNQLQHIVSQISICDSLFRKQTKNINKENLVSIDNKTYSVEDFVVYFSEHKKTICSIYNTTTDALYYGLNYFIYHHLKEIEDQQLFDTNPQLKAVADEYFNGLLYFDIMSDKVWDKAQNDKKSLEELYNKNKENYKWGEPRYEGYLIFTKNKSLEQRAKLIIQNNKENFITILKDSLNKDKDINIIVDKGFWSKGENQYIDELLYNAPSSKVMVGYPSFFFEGIKIEQPRNVNDVRGAVTSDYQKDLEKEWINSLRQKTTITINEDVLNSISKKNN